MKIRQIRSIGTLTEKMPTKSQTSLSSSSRNQNSSRAVEILRNSAGLSSSIQKVISARHRAAEDMRQLRQQLEYYQKANERVNQRISRLKQTRSELEYGETQLRECIERSASLARKVHQEWQHQFLHQLTISVDGWLLVLQECELSLAAATSNAPGTLSPNRSHHSQPEELSPMLFPPQHPLDFTTFNNRNNDHTVHPPAPPPPPSSSSLPSKRLLVNYRPQLDAIAD